MSRRNRFPILTLILALAAGTCLLAACGGDGDEPASNLSRAERDSVLSETQLPGAATVKGALDVADTAQARADRTEKAADR